MTKRSTARARRPMDALAARLTTGALNRATRRRGVAMIEYVLLIAIAVVLAWLLRDQLTSMFSGILDDIRNALRTS